MTRTGWTVFVAAPTGTLRILPLQAKWICGDGRLSRANYTFPQVPPPLLACQATDNSLPLHETPFFGHHRGIASDYCPLLWFWNFRPPCIGRQERFGF